MIVSFIALGCDKNLVNCEQMMALCQKAGYILQTNQEGADVVVVNTCGFIESAKVEAINTILEVAQLKAEGKVKKIIVTGCLTQRYQEDVLKEFPEVDGVLGTGSYSDIVSAIHEVMENHPACHFGSIHAPIEEIDRVITTPKYYAWLRIAEGCDNHCSYCVIPSLRGKYRSRKIEDILREAQRLADAGVKELMIIAQDTTRYGTDLYGKHCLAQLLEELCKMDFHWIRLHYLYPDEITEDLIDVIAKEEKVLPYLDLPLQHCNNKVLKAMNRRTTKEHMLTLIKNLRERIPGLVLRTSLIAGLPYEDEEAFEELCEFLREVRIERVGVFTFSPEEGTPAEKMPRVEMEVAERRNEMLVDIQSDIIDAFNDSRLGTTVEVLCEGFDNEAMAYVGRSYAESPEIDGRIYFASEEDVETGSFVSVRITDTMDGELVGERE